MTTTSASRFAAWQEANQVRRESILSDYLEFLAKTRVKVRNATDLADLVARHIADVEGKPCNKSTLLRNIRYKAKILSYQAKGQTLGVKTLNTRGVSDPGVSALVARAQLECGNLRRELARLNAYTCTLEEQLGQLRSAGRMLPNLPVEPIKKTDPIAEVEFQFVRTCQTLRLLLVSFNSIVQLDPNGRRILDMSKRRNNVIADQDVAGPFFDWLKQQGGYIK